MIELKILEDSLVKKKSILMRIEEENKNQENILKANPVSSADFEATIDKKTGLIAELNKLDQGFENLYDRIKEQLVTEQSAHRQQVAILKDLISEITDLSVAIQAQEARNKGLVEKFFSQNKQGIQADRIRAKSAYDYMNRMAGQEVAPRFMDTKK